MSWTNESQAWLYLPGLFVPEPETVKQLVEDDTVLDTAGSQG